MLVNIDGHEGLVRDCSTRAVLNTNQVEYEKYLQKRDQQLRAKQLADQQASELANLKNEIGEIKQLIALLAQNINTQANK